MSVARARHRLVSQIPSFIIATASAVIITKTSSSESLSKDLSGQMLSQPNAVAFAGGILAIFSIIPGLPKLPFMILAGFFGIMFFLLKRSSKKLAVEEMEQRETKKTAHEPQSEEGVEKLFHVDRMGIEVGYKIVPLVDSQKNGGILERINALRRQMARDMGMIVPRIRVRDNLQLGANQYVIKMGEGCCKGRYIFGLLSRYRFRHNYEIGWRNENIRSSLWFTCLVDIRSRKR